MWKRCLKVSAIVGLTLLPVGIWFVYWETTKLPEQITIAAGSEGGRYRVISMRLKAAIEAKLDIQVVILPTEGSLGNILCLEAGKADFALYQPGTIEILRAHDRGLVQAAAGLVSETEEVENVAFVANLYMQPAQFIVRSGANIERPGDLRPQPDGRRRTVCVGLTQSGDYAMSLVLLEHFGLDKDEIDTRHLTYDQIADGFLKDDLDETQKLEAAFNTVAQPAPVLQKLFKTGKCGIL